MTESDRPDAAVQPPPGGGWSAGVIPGWVLVVGLVVIAVAGLGLATLGGVGIVLVAVLELLVIALLYRWGAATAPR